MNIKISDLVLFIYSGLLIAFVLKMIQLYETTGGVPGELIPYVLGGGVFELGFNALITICKNKKKKESE